jgi:hypothetical protein
MDLLCGRCDNAYPNEYMHALHTNEGAFFFCPRCALKQVNEIHGLPEDTPFRGYVARGLYNDFVKRYPEKEKQND